MEIGIGAVLCGIVQQAFFCVQVMQSGLDDAPPAGPLKPEEFLTAAEALIPGKAPQPKPGEAQVFSLRHICIAFDGS